MGAPEIPDFNEYRFIEGETRQVIEKHNLQMGALNTFAEGLVDYVKEQGEALLVAGGAIFPTVAAGMAAAPDDGYFYAENPDPNISKTLYQRLSDIEYRKVADDPTVEFLSGVAAAQYAAIELASQPGRLSHVFPKTDKALPLLTIAGSKGESLATWDEHGYLLNQSRGIFPKNDENPTIFSIAGQDKKQLLGVDQYGQPVIPWIKIFPKSDKQPEYCYIDKNWRVFLGWNAQGRFEIGGGDSSNLPVSPQYIADGRLWSNGHDIKMRPEYSALYFTPVDTLFPTFVDVNAAYHELVSEFPDYVSSELLGVDKWGNEIWAFHFSPAGQSPHNTAYPESIIKLQKYLITTGVHAGDEKHPIVATYIFFHELCREWMRHKRMDQFRWDVEFKIIPVLNPSGYNAGTRLTADGIDLNRNAPTNWESASLSTRGPYPASEPETQIWMAWIDNNLDADMVVDHHRNRNLNNDQFGWIGTSSEKGLAMSIKTVNEIVAFGKQHFDFIPQDNRTVRFVGKHIDGSLVGHSHATTSIESFLLETVRDVANASNAIYTRRYLSVEALKIFLSNFYQKRQREREIFMPIDNS